MSVYEDIRASASETGEEANFETTGQNISALNDNIPALLLPYRMETRFQQKEYVVRYITESYPQPDPPDVDPVDPIDPIDPDTPDIDVGVEPPSNPVFECLDASYRIRTDLKTYQQDVRVRSCCIGGGNIPEPIDPEPLPPIGEPPVNPPVVDPPDIDPTVPIDPPDGDTTVIQRYLAELSHRLDYIKIANSAGKHNLITSLKEIQAAAQQTEVTLQEQKKLLREVIQEMETAKVTIGHDLDFLNQRYSSNTGISEGVEFGNTQARFDIFLDQLDAAATNFDLATNDVVRGEVASSSATEVGECTSTAVAVSKRLTIIDEEQFSQVQTRLNELTTQFNNLVSVFNDATAEFNQQMDDIDVASGAVRDIATFADEGVTTFSSLPVAPDDTELPPSPIYEVHERTEIRWELLVRVYPDEIEIDTHEPELTDEEYRDGRLFWESIWYNPTNQEAGIEAWRPLIAAYGRPRAAWVVKATTPTNIEVDLTLNNTPAAGIEPGSLSMSQSQVQSGQNYWTNIWTSNSRASYSAAWLQLVQQYGVPTANIIAFVTMPVNMEDRAVNRMIKEGFNISSSRSNSPQFPTQMQMSSRNDEVFAVQRVPGQNADPIFPEQERREDSWTRAPLVRVLPDKFTVVLQHQTGGRTQYSGNILPTDPLAVGLNPNFEETRSENDPPETYFEGEEIMEGQVDEDFEGIEESIPQVEPEIKWMTDFAEAERIGMGIRATLGEEKPDAYDKVFVLGLKTDGDNSAETGKSLVTELFNSLHYTGAGLSLLRQGMPTNNTEDEDAGFNGDDSTGEESFRNELSGPLFSRKFDKINKRDGQWLAELLGIDYKTVYNLDNADNLDIANAFAMNQALVSGTLLPFAEQLLSKQFVNTSNPSQALYYLDEVRSFFTQNVSGRGIIPPIRVDSQPYGILATSAHSKWVSTSTDPEFHNELKSFMDILGSNWDAMRRQSVEQIDQEILVTGIDKQNDPVVYADKELELGQARFMKLLGLNPISTEWHQQMGMSQGPSGANLLGLLEQANFFNPDLSHFNLLANEFGVASSKARANLIDKLQWFGENQRLRGGLVDKLEAEGTYLSELLAGKNYIDLLLDASLPTIRSQDYHLALDPDAGSFNYPNSLLYLYLRYALLNQYFDAGMRVLDNTVNDPDNLFGTKGRISLNIFQSSGSSPNANVSTQWDYLLQAFSNYSLKTGVDFTNYDHIADYLKSTYRSNEYRQAKANLLETRKALEILSKVPVKNLERDFLEHLDLCNYRLDAWQTGLVNHRLQKQREENRSGIYLGGFSWVENLSPEDNLVEVPENEIPEDINPEDREMYYDPKNMGLVLAPSHQHAVSAAVLRNAYVSNYESNNNSKVAVNLSSERIRLARHIIEGVRNGQSMAALLGYRFERTLLEISIKEPSLNLERHILDIRKKYPLAEIENKEDSENSQAIKDSIAANNVVDGLLLFENYRDQESDFVSWINNFEQNEKTAIQSAIDTLANAVDSISDVAVCEAVFHTIGGNTERAKAFSEALSKNGLMPNPEAFEIKNNGLTITHTLGVSFPPVRETPQEIATNPDNQQRTPRSLGEPSLDRWLSGILPQTSDIRLSVEYEGLENPEVWSAQMLNLYPIDLLYLVRPTLRNDDGDLATFIRHQIRCERNLSEDIEIKIDFSTAGLLGTETDNPNMVSFSEIELAVEKINTLIGKGSELSSENFQRYDAPPVNQNNNDSFFDNNPEGYDIDHLRQRVLMLIDGDFFVGENDTGNLGNGGGLIPAGGGGLPIDPGPIFFPNAECKLAFRGIGILVDEISNLTNQASANPLERNIIGKAIKTRLLLLWKYGFDLALPGRLSNDADEKFNQLFKIARTVIGELRPKIEKARALAAENTELSPKEAFENLKEAVSLVTGYNYKLFPLFRVRNQEELNTGVQNTQIYNASATEDPDLPESHTADEIELLMHDWLGELARMREPVAIMDDALMYAENIMTEEPAFSLHPIQYPTQEEEENFWLGMEFPDTTELEVAKKSIVLYGDKPSTGDWCGLLIDEWNETIPDKNRNVAVAFHYDQPNAKAPNCLLLAVTPEETGSWSWDDMVDTLDETLEMAKKRAVEPEHMDDYKKRGSHMFPKIFPAIAAPILDAERGFTLDLAENNNERLYERKTFAKDAGVTLTADGSHFENEDRTKDEPESAGAGGFAVQSGRTDVEFD